MARANLQIKAGTYTGDGNDNRVIPGIGFEPQFLIVKGGANVACVRTKEMRGDMSVSMASALATAANQIQGFTNDGFVVGTSALVNANGTVYYYVAISGTVGQNYFRTGNYVGTGADNRDFTVGGINFTPDFVSIFGNTTQDKLWRSSSMSSEVCQYFSATAQATSDRIQNLQTNGFQLGTNAQVNSSGVEYFFAALKALSGVISFGTYSGDGNDNRSISGIGFTPDFVLVKKAEATARAGLMRTSGISGDSTLFCDATAAGTNRIQAIETDGFQVGTDNSINAAGATYFWMALKAGSFSAPITRTSV